MDDVKRLDLNIADAMALGGELFRASMFADAEKLFEQIVAADPLNVHAHNALSVCLIEQKKCAEALPHIERAGLLLREEMLTVSCNRGRALADLGRSEEALITLNGVLKACPDHQISLYNRALVLLQMNRCREASVQFDRVLEIDPGNDKARFGRGFANLVLGNYTDGFRDYECRLKDAITEPDVPLWTGAEDIAGKTILVHGEQGLGDNIMFARYLPLMVERGAKVLLWTPKSVRPLLDHLPGVTVLATDDQSEWPKFDLWVRFMSLAWCFGTTAETVPLPVPVLHRWRRSTHGQRPRIGLVWSGGRESRYDEYRSVPLQQLIPLMGLDADFFSLQLDVRDSDAAAFKTFTTLGLIDLSPRLTDFRATARIMSGLDAVVTCDTSVAHLAGTVGVPTFVMLTAFRTYWLWIEKRATSPWYPSVRVVRQSKDGEWAPVIEAVRNGLADLGAARAA